MKSVFSVLLIGLFTVSAFGDTYYVKADGSGDYPTIQAAINDSNNGDTIILYPKITHKKKMKRGR